MILRPCWARVRPVWVFSMSRSASSGRKASLAPQVGMRRQGLRRFSLRVPVGNVDVLRGYPESGDVLPAQRRPEILGGLERQFLAHHGHYPDFAETESEDLLDRTRWEPVQVVGQPVFAGDGEVKVPVGHLERHVLRANDLDVDAIQVDRGTAWVLWVVGDRRCLLWPGTRASASAGARQQGRARQSRSRRDVWGMTGSCGMSGARLFSGGGCCFPTVGAYAIQQRTHVLGLPARTVGNEIGA